MIKIIADSLGENIMKRIWKELIIAVICILVFPLSANASVADNAKRAYAKALAQNGAGNAFILIDINNDAVPELFVKYSYQTGYSLYGFVGGRIKNIKNYVPKQSIKLYPSRSILMTQQIGGGTYPLHRCYMDYYYYNNGLKLVFGKIDYFEQNKVTYHDGNNNAIDSRKYNNLVSQWLGNPEPPSVEIGKDACPWRENRRKYLSVSTTPTVAQPGVPTITSIKPGNNCFVVKWTKAANAKRYYVFRRIGNGKYERIAVVDSGTLSYTDRIVPSTEGRAYTYAVKAYNAGVFSSHRPQSYIWLSHKTITECNSTGGKIKVCWNRSPAAAGYRIRYSMNSSFQNAKDLYIRNPATTRVHLSGLKGGTRYYISLCCYYQSGGKFYYSAFCKPVSVVCSYDQSSVTPRISISTGAAGSQTMQLTASSNVSGTITWKSSNESVATVSGGTVTARGAGTAVITASVSYGGRVYSASRTITVNGRTNYGAWSAWTTGSVSGSSNIEVDRRTLYRYYCFACPACGGREPFQGTSDCHRYTLTAADSQIIWSPIAYSACNSQGYSYTTAKRYTESLGDGKRWNFSAGNLHDTAVGTMDAAGPDAVVITAGYRTRNVSTTYYIAKAE